MAEEKKKKRRAYLESFQKDENGKYVYKGDAYIYKGMNNRKGTGNSKGKDSINKETGKNRGKDSIVGNGGYKKSSSSAQENDLRRELVSLSAMGAALMVALVAAGCITAPGMDNCFYVLLPYVAGLMAGVSVCWALYRLITGGTPLKSYIYDASVKALPVRTVLVIVCSELNIVGEIVFIFRQGTDGKIFSCCFFFVINALIILLSLAIRRKILSMQWEK